MSRISTSIKKAPVRAGMWFPCSRCPGRAVRLLDLPSTEPATCLDCGLVLPPVAIQEAFRLNQLSFCGLWSCPYCLQDNVLFPPAALEMEGRVARLKAWGIPSIGLCGCGRPVRMDLTGNAFLQVRMHHPAPETASRVGMFPPLGPQTVYH